MAAETYISTWKKKKKKDFTIAHLFVFYQSTHSVTINTKSQFLPWKNYPPCFPKHWNMKNRCLDLISDEKCSFLARNSLANGEGKNMEICWPVPVFTSSNMTLASLINTAAQKWRWEGSGEHRPGSGDNIHRDETLQSILSSADTQRRTFFAFLFKWKWMS